MSGFPTVNFGQPESGLFSPEEIARLMQVEYQRSQRYGYPLSVLLIEIDRLESLHDLYGMDSKQRILRAVLSLVRSSTRASDVLGRLRDDRLMILFPHTPREAAAAIARRLLAGCRELEFRGDGRILRATLSIGAAQRAPEADFAGLTEDGERALASAVEAGGDRFVDSGSLPRRAPPRPAPASEVPAAVPARARHASPPSNAPLLPPAHELAGTTLEEKVASLFAHLGGRAQLAGLEREVVDVLRRTLAETRAAPASQAEVRAQMRALEARIAELRRMLGASEEELERMLAEKSVDPGVASIYRSVQGLDPRERNFAQKKELLAVIYRANVELLRQLEREVGPAPGDS